MFANTDNVVVIIASSCQLPYPFRYPSYVSAAFSLQATRRGQFFFFSRRAES